MSVIIQIQQWQVPCLRLDFGKDKMEHKVHKLNVHKHIMFKNVNNVFMKMTVGYIIEEIQNTL
jgi:hypothetical protein